MNTVPYWMVLLTAFASATLIGMGLPALYPYLEAHARRGKLYDEQLFDFDSTGWEVVWQGIFTALLLAIAGWMVGGAVFLLPALYAGYNFPRWSLEGKIRDRHEKLQAQLVEATGAIVNSLRAGQTLFQAIDECCRTNLLPHPILEEFQIMSREYKLGTTQDLVLENAKIRFKSRDFDLLCSAINVSIDRGGNLTDTLARIAQFMQEVARLRENINVKTAQSRKVALFMRFIPFLIIAVLYMVDPAGVSLLFNTIYGNVLLLVVVMLNVAAYMWTDSILQTEL